MRVSCYDSIASQQHHQQGTKSSTNETMGTFYIQIIRDEKGSVKEKLKAMQAE